MKLFNVATYAHRTDKGSLRVMAYTRYYSESWEGFYGYSIEAESGAEAKKIAIAMRKEKELQGPRK